ncbi:MAG: hypothetical protein E6R04_02530 [Spirochaetes bacterium]|nr:MAG: hypothetical protein E6R04_02530 [Spirochaetota bacterium]
MKLVDSAANYPRETVETFMMKASSIGKTIEEADKVLMKELEEPSPAKEGDNVFHVDFRPFTEFTAVQGNPVTLPELLALYERWTDIYWELVMANVGHYSRHKIVGHVLSHRKVVETFGAFLGQ